MSEEMKKVELLAPAGSMEALRAAVQNGCDALYLGGAMFGARAFAANFDEVQMKEAIAYAHVYGVRVFVTINTLLYESEIESCLQYIAFLQDHDVDALIIQDIGLFTLVKECFPDMELHASTQMHVHNPQGISLLKKMGAERVVVPRETPIEEIQEYAKLGIDLEVFVQGALCVSYSGQCFMSALTLQRSGNRGECAQSCRMQYALKKHEHGNDTIIDTKGKYLLSPKDLNTLTNIPELIEAGIASFKIEGRMKRAEYVALMVSNYRQAIDAYYAKQEFHVDAQMDEDMKKVFHRGFTAGHLFKQRGSRLMNAIRPNHIGIEVGEVIAITRDKMRIRLFKDLQQGDGVRLLKNQEDEGFRINRMYKDGLLVNHASAQETIELDKTSYVEKGTRLVKTSDTLQLKALQKTYETTQRYVMIHGSFQMRIGKQAMLRVWDYEGNYLEGCSVELVEQAQKTPLDQARIEVQLRKSKDTVFMFQDIAFDLDEQGILPIKALNLLRREVLVAFAKKREQRHAPRAFVPYAKTLTAQPQTHALHVVVHTYEQYRACKEVTCSIFVSGEKLYHKIKEEDSCVNYQQPRVMKGVYGDTYELIQEVGGLAIERVCMSDASIHLTNAYTAAFLFEHDVQTATLSLEADFETSKHIASTFQERYGYAGNFAYQVYGRVKLMISEYCAINACVKDNDKKRCGLCRGIARYSLIDMKKKEYPLMGDEQCRMILLDAAARNRIHEIQALSQAHITNYVCVFTIETQEQCAQIMQACMTAMARGGTCT